MLIKNNIKLIILQYFWSIETAEKLAIICIENIYTWLKMIQVLVWICTQIKQARANIFRLDL